MKFLVSLLLIGFFAKQNFAEVDALEEGAQENVHRQKFSDAFITEQQTIIYNLYKDEFERLTKYQNDAMSEYNLAKEEFDKSLGTNDLTLDTLSSVVSDYKKAIIDTLTKKLPKDNDEINKIIQGLGNLNFNMQLDKLHDAKEILERKQREAKENEEIIKLNDKLIGARMKTYGATIKPRNYCIKSILMRLKQQIESAEHSNLIEKKRCALDKFELFRNYM